MCARPLGPLWKGGSDPCRSDGAQHLGDSDEQGEDRQASLGEDTCPVLERLRADLGLPDGCTLEAELHSMLVYAPGQFFVRHQDSEKSDEMVGSLVVTLPSSFTGGALEVEHRGDTTSFWGSKKKLSFVAFYSDCRHQIKPVRSGYRVVLTTTWCCAASQRPATHPMLSWWRSWHAASRSTSPSYRDRAAWSTCSTMSTPSGG